MKEINLKQNVSEFDKISCKYGLKELNNLKCYELEEQKGLFIMPSPFLSGYQRYFVKKCLLEYHNLPNKTNLDLHTKRENNLWNEEKIK